MAMRHTLHPLDPDYQEGRRMALEMSHDHILAEARRAADERKRAGSGGGAPQSSKRDCVGRGKPRGRRGGRRKALAAVTSHSEQCRTLPSPTEDYFAQQKPQEEFEQNMERLSAILASCPPVEPQNHSSSSWAVRQQKASERWKEARPYHLRCLLEVEAVGHPLCCLCCQPAVIRCRDCLPDEWFCGDCDILQHKKQPLHNRDCVLDGFFKSIPPSTCIIRGEGGQYVTCDQACILPTVRAPICSCGGQDFSVSAGKTVILITINGRYDLHLPVYGCKTCQQQWTPDMKDLLRSGYWPASANASTLYTLDLLESFQELKVISPGFARQAFAKLLEYRTKSAGRSGYINGDALQRSFLEYSYSSFEEDQLCYGAPFTCPACTPEMVAVSADGNRKLYRFRQSGRSDDSAFFDGLFLAKDNEVSEFVEAVQNAVKNTQGRGTCGDSQWTAARETSRRASKLDEEGVEVAVCRHGYLLKGLNMYRGEIFAYPLYLQKELLPAKAKFFATDVACKYWPYMVKVASVLPALQGLTDMKPFLSVMHARAHATKCEVKWSGRNQEGAGTTAGEEVEQVNSYLSRCALTTKYMSKAARVDMLTVYAMGWNRQKTETLHQALSTRYVKISERALEAAARLSDMKIELNCSDVVASQWIAEVQEWAADETENGTNLQQVIEGLYLGVKLRKQNLYRQNDSNKVRHRLRKKLADDKMRLLQEMAKYNSLTSDSTKKIDVTAVEQSLGGHSSPLWPWEAHSNVAMDLKKKLHDQQMLTARLQEERSILVLEMAQHCTWLQNLAVVLRNKLGEEAVDEADEGLRCLLKKRLSEVTERLQVVLSRYKTALGPEASVFLNVGEEEECDHIGLSSPDTSEDEEAEDTI